MTLIASWGGAGSNSYLVVTDATSLVAEQVLDSSAWTAATSAQQSVALVAATRDIDAYDYAGSKYYYDQGLSFPRALPIYSDGYTRTSIASTNFSITQRDMQRDVYAATVAQAVFLLRAVSLQEHADRRAAGLSAWSESVGPIRESATYQSGGPASRLCPDAIAYIRGWLVGRKVSRG